jgi:hypothetical protein
MRIADDIASRFAGQDLEVLANYTGGTKTMSVGLAAFAVRFGWGLQLNATGRERTNLVKITGGDIPLPQDTTVLHVRDAVVTAKEQAARHAYEVAVETLTMALTRMRLPPLEQVALVKLRTESQMRASWDRFDYQGALDVAGRDADLKACFAEKLHQLIQIRKLCEQSGEWTRRDLTGAALVEDLVKNAEICAARGRYDAAGNVTPSIAVRISMR